MGHALKDPVRCRAEHGYPGRPTEIWFDQGWHPVTGIIEEHQAPSGKKFRVVCDGTTEISILYDPVLDKWQIFPPA